jgi:signal transduction histidine kinase
MTSRLPLWLAGFLVLLVVLFLGWTEYTNWRELVRLQRRFRDLELNSAATEFQAHLLKLNGPWATQGLSLGGRDSAFEAEGERLRTWLQSRQQALAGLGNEAAAETGLVAQASARLNAYLEAARRLPAAAATPGGFPAEVQPLRTEWEALIALAGQWTRLHQASLEAEIAEAQRSLRLLHALLAVSFFLLLALALAVLVLVKRGLLAPLRRQLVASHAIIARQEKLASLGVLAAGVAHEIRNPLTAINARLFSQQKRLAAGSPEHADALVIKEEIQRLERIVRDVLQFARPGEPVLELQGALAFLREVAALMAPTLEKRGITLTVEAGDERSVYLDPAQMKQVMINLIQNAADSIGEAGRITLRACQAVLPLASRRTEAVALDVEDTGRGIPPEVQARLFDPFFTTKASGTGLGLAIAERIAQKHGGSLQFRTQVGRGTTFSVVLPAAAAADTRNDKGSIPSASPPPRV